MSRRHKFRPGPPQGLDAPKYLLPPAPPPPTIEPHELIHFPFPEKVDLATITNVFEIHARLLLLKNQTHHIQMSMPPDQKAFLAIPMIEAWLTHVCERAPQGFDTMLHSIFEEVMQKQREKLAEAWAESKKEQRAPESGFILNPSDVTGTHIPLNVPTIGDVTP